MFSVCVYLHHHSACVLVFHRWLDPATDKASPAEFKVEKEDRRWLRLRGSYLLDLPVVFGPEEASK